MNIKVQTTEEYIESRIKIYEKKHGKNRQVVSMLIPPILIDKTSIDRYVDEYKMEEK